MIKKSFGVALLVTSALVMGCSSDDDAVTDAVDTATTAGTDTDTTAGTDTDTTAGTDTDTTAGTDTDGDTTDPVDGGTSYNANSVMGVIAADPRLSLIAGALNPDFDQPLDTAGQGWTVFAPTDEAVQAALDSGATVTTAVLQSHIYTQGAVAAADLTPGQVVSMSNNSEYTITANAAGDGLLINGIAIIQADLAVDNGALHVIDGVLIPNN